MQNNQSNKCCNNDAEIDVTKLSGYQEVPTDCPAWKAAIIEKKNQELYEKAKSDIMNQRQEEDKWRDIPEWKRNLIKDKEKRKMEEAAPMEAERKRKEEELARLQAMPEWKRDLILKKRDL